MGEQCVRILRSCSHATKGPSTTSRTFPKQRAGVNTIPSEPPKLPGMVEDDATTYHFLPRDSKQRVVNDSVHKHFVLSGCSFQFIDTPVFQRLRRLSQLGKTSMVFPTASHTRFEHSLGVAHLAGQYAENLLLEQKDDNLSTWKHVAELAGLLHDLGHGPFSHLFEKRVIPRVCSGLQWSHEDMSLKLIDYIVDNHFIDLDKTCLGENHMSIVKELIKGNRPGACNSSAPLFLWDLIANQRDGLDVDKFDYLQRDAKQCGLTLSTSFSRLPFIMKVIDNKICYRLKEENEVFNVFWDRARMHSVVYQHRKIMACELMVADALGAIATELGLVEKVRDPEKYLTLDDHVERACFWMDSSASGVMKARKLIEDMNSRKLYQFAQEIVVPGSHSDLPSWKLPTPEDITQYQNSDGLVNLIPADIRLGLARINYGKRADNPILHVKFFEYDCHGEQYQRVGFPRSERDRELRKPYEDMRLRVYSVNTDHRYVRAVSQAVSNWVCREHPHLDSKRIDYVTR